MIDFSINTNIFFSPERALEILRNNVDKVTQYPDDANEKIIHTLSRFLNVSEDNLGVGVGSTQLIADIPKIIDYNRAVILSPTFWEYAFFNNRAERPIEKIFLSEHNDFKPPYDTLGRLLKPGDCVFICNLNNPTGTLYNRDRLLDIIQKNPNTHFVIDETYLLFREDYRQNSLIQVAAQRENMWIVTSLSKFFSLPGLRVGALVSTSKNVENYISKFYIPYSMSPFTGDVLGAVMGDEEAIVASRKKGLQELRIMQDKFAKRLGGRLKCFPSSGCFILAKILTQQTSEEIKARLEAEGFIVRGGHELPDLTNEWLRFSVRERVDNEKLVNALDRLLVG